MGPHLLTDSRLLKTLPSAFFGMRSLTRTRIYELALRDQREKMNKEIQVPLAL